MALPKPRYRVVERGRRLVTIDTLTGQEFGAASPAPPAMPHRLSVAPPSEVPTRPAPGPDKRQSALAGKLIVLAAGGALLAFFLVVTGLWLFALIPFAIPQARTFILAKGKAALAKYLDQAATG